jgi:hypothetical protein
MLIGQVMTFLRQLRFCVYSSMTLRAGSGSRMDTEAVSRFLDEKKVYLRLY